MITFDERRFAHVFRKVFRAFEAQTHLFAVLSYKTVGPQHLNCPKKITVGSREFMYWLTLTAWCDKRTNSADLYAKMALLFSNHRQFFDVGYLPKEGYLANLFRRYGLGLMQSVPREFIERKRHLDSFFDGDPREIYRGTKTIEELMKKLQDLGRNSGVGNIFPGAKEKIFTLLAMFLSELSELDFGEVVPIDVWVQSISTSTGVLKGRGQIDHNEVERTLRPLMASLFNNKFRHVQGAANATYMLGVELCKTCRVRDHRATCPIYSDCNGPFKRTRHPESGKHYGRITIPPDYIGKNGDGQKNLFVAD